MKKQLNLLLAFLGGAAFMAILVHFKNEIKPPERVKLFNMVDSRSFFYDNSNLIYRPYKDSCEVFSYLNGHMSGRFAVYVDNKGRAVADTIDNGRFIHKP